jgi:hypothetical protein
MTTGPRRELVALALVVGIGLAGCQARDGERLLRQGRFEELLRRVRATGPTSYWLRARALRGLGRPQAARTELLIGLVLDESSAEGHRLLGELEAELGEEGAALAELQRALEVDSRQLAVRRLVARLLVRRAVLRAGALGSVAEAKDDLRLARRLDPGLQVSEATLASASSASGDTARCPGPPSDLSRAPVAVGRACVLRRPERLLLRLQRRALLVGCQGAQLARRLAAAGCRGEALEVWAALMAEAPSDPRWPLEAARMQLALGRERQATLTLVDHVYLSRDRAAGLLQAARTLIAGGAQQLGARLAVEAAMFTRRREQIDELVELLRQAGLTAEAEEIRRR